MSQSPNADQVQQFRARADELRGQAAGWHASDFRQQLLEIARQYDVLADSIERRLHKAT